MSLPLTWRERFALWLVPDYARMRDLNLDLAAQVRDLTSTGSIDPDELRALRDLRVQHTTMFNEQRALGLWIRDRFKDDIAAGRHAGKSTIEVLEMHLNERGK